MVLEEATSESGWGNEAGSSSSGPSPYDESPAVSTNAANIDLSRYARPIAIVGPLFGFTEANQRLIITEALKSGQAALRRPLRETERDALVEDVCARTRTMSAAPMFGLSLGLGRAYQTRASWRLPFWAMGKDFDPAQVKAPGGGEAGRVLLRGEPAKVFWRVLRNSLYGANGVAVAMLVAAQLAMASSSARLATDPRLKDLLDAIRNMTREDRAERIQRMQKERERLRGRNAARGQPPAQSEPQTGAWDDASPSGGSAADDYTFSGSTGAGAASATVQAAQAQQKQQPQQQRWSRQPPSPAQPAQGGGFYEDWDDASPTAGPPAQQRQPGSTAQGSAWERLRQQAASEEQQQGQQSQSTWRGPPQPRGDYSFSSGDRDRELARDEAQKEFDARVERERSGGNFGGSSGGRQW